MLQRHCFVCWKAMALPPTLSINRSRMRLLVMHTTANHVCALTSPPNSQLEAYKRPSASADITALCRNGQLKEALHILHAMDQQGIPADSQTYASLLQACGDLKALPEGKWVHTHMLRNAISCGQDIVLETKLVGMYGKCGSLVDARLVFEKIPNRNVFLWNAIIRGYAAQALSQEVLALYCQMQRSGVRPDSFSFSCALKACAEISALGQGKGIHERIISSGFESDVFVGNALAAMYAKCGHMENARQVFDGMSQRDVVSWNGMIAGYVHNERCRDALSLSREMVPAGMTPNPVTMVSVLSACADRASVQLGKEVHGCVIRNGFEADALVRNSLVAMYAKCQSLGDAGHVFDKMLERDVASWTAMIAGYAQNGSCDDALKLFRQMQLAAVKASPISVSSVLPACARLAALERGKEIHAHAIGSGIDSNVIVASALVAMYAKCGNIVDACQVFDKMSQKDVVAWNVMIAAHSQSSHCDKVLKLFGEMQAVGVEADPFTIVSILSACAHLSALQQGKQIHDYIIRSGFISNVIVGSALVDMYAKCGNLEDAWQWFSEMCQRDVVSWNAMIAGYGMHGYGKEALTLFNQMQQVGMRPDHITFTGILSACSHAGLVDEGLQYFDHISQHYHITPNVEHYACVVDLLGRAGHLHKAYEFIQSMPLEPNGSVWGALLGACRIHGNVDLGEHVAKCLFELEPQNEGNYVLLSNIYAVTGRWDDAVKIRKMMKDRGLTKKPGCSWIEVENKVHIFLVGDKTHPQTEKIYAILETLTGQMRKAGYVPDTNFVLIDVEK